MSGRLLVFEDDGDKIILARKGNRGTFWVTRGELQALWQAYREQVKADPNKETAP